MGDCHVQRGAGESVQPAHQNRPQAGRAANADSPRHRRRAKRAGVEQHHPRKSLRRSQRRSQADRPAPILRHERHIAQIQLGDKSRQIVDMRRQPIIERRRLVAEPAADVIRRDDAMMAAPSGDQVPPVERPGRIAMHQQQRRAAAFVKIMIAAGFQGAGNARRTDTAGAKWLRASFRIWLQTSNTAYGIAGLTGPDRANIPVVRGRDQ